MSTDYPDYTLPIVVIGTVTVTGSVIVSGPVTVATVTADNIVIDKLTVGAYTERRSTLKNDNNVTTPTAPPMSDAGVSFRGKFFPRGMRGFIDALQIYCYRTGAGTVTLAYAPNIGMGEVGSVTITPNANWNWHSGAINRMWNYDSLFIWVKSISADVHYGYDDAMPYDFFSSGDSGLTWSAVSYRMYFRAVESGETCGDVPVSGTVNNIEIPNATAARQYRTLDVPAKTEVLDAIQYGSGRLIIAIFNVGTIESRDMLRPRIYCDGIKILPEDKTFIEWNDFYVSASSEGICIGVWNTSIDNYSLIVKLPFPFKRSLQIGYYNADDADIRTGYVGYTYEKIS